jgi:hypothetical protein
MQSEDAVTRQLQEFQELAKNNKGIDTTALALNALAQAQAEEEDAKGKRKAYWISIGIPPLGLLFALYYVLSSKSDGKRVALNCCILTAVSLLIGWGIGAVVMSGFTPQQSAQIQNVNMNDVQGLKDILNQQ